MCMVQLLPQLEVDDVATIGSFADIVFEVSMDKVLTPSDISRGGSARWSTHDINMKKPMPEFLGPGQEAVSYKIVLKASHGVAPDKTMDILRNFRDAGKVSSFVLGSKPVTSNYWYIDDIQENHKQIDGAGRILFIEATLSLKEYPKISPVRSKFQFKKKPNLSKKKTAKEAKLIGAITIKVKTLNQRTSPSLKGKVKGQLFKNRTYNVYGKVKTDIEWYDLGGGLYCSAGSKYTSFKKA